MPAGNSGCGCKPNISFVSSSSQRSRSAFASGARYAVLTGLDDVPLLQESIRLRVSDYLIKPVNKEELFSLIDRTQEQLKQEKQNDALDLAEAFRTAAQSDEEIYAALKDQTNRSDSPVETLDQFIRAAGREIPFWQVCGLANEMAEDARAPKEIMDLLRALPLEKPINSPEVSERESHLTQRCPLRKSPHWRAKPQMRFPMRKSGWKTS